MTAALEGGEWSAVRPGRTLLRERPSTHFTGGWVGPRVGLNGRKISSPPGFDPGPSSPCQSLYRLRYPARTHCRCRGILLHMITMTYTRTHTHTHTHTDMRTRTPLDDRSARPRDLYVATHIDRKRQKSMPPTRLEPAIPASERPQTHTSDHAATGMGAIR